MRVTFEFLRQINKLRCKTAFGRDVDDWSPAEWACALAGEVGELCNEIKKRFRGDADAPTTEVIADEIADVLTYLDLLAERHGIDLELALVRKFNRVSDRRGCDVVIRSSSPRIGGRTQECMVLIPPSGLCIGACGNARMDGTHMRTFDCEGPK